MAEIKINKTAAAGVETPLADKVSIFVDSADDKLKYKDENGDIGVVASEGEVDSKISTAAVAAASDAEVKTGTNTTKYLTPKTAADNYGKVVMGSFTKNSEDASIVQTIAHGLGRVPKKVEFFYAPVGNYSNTLVFHGIYNGTSTVNIGGGTGNPVQVGLDTTNVMSLVYTTGSGNYAVCTFDATNITLTWTKSGSPSGNRYIGRQAE